MNESKRLSLDGEWSLRFDPGNEGAAGEWGARGVPASAKCIPVKVPSLWNDVDNHYTGVAFYERTFTAPRSGSGERVLLRFGGVNHVAQVWVNGRHVGSHEGGYSPFQFDVTDCLSHEVSNRLTVRVLDFPKTGAVEDRTIAQTACAKETWYYTYGGIHAPVSLDVVPAVHLTDVQLLATGQARSVTLRATLNDALGQPASAKVRVQVLDASGACLGEATAQVLLTGQAQSVSVTARAPSARLWSQEEPALYSLRIELSTPAGEQTVVRRFGFRDCAFRQGRFFLNGRQVQLKGVLLQPNYPVSLINPRDLEMARREIRLIREAGFNCVRSHVRPSPEEYLDLCDEAGLLVYQETSCAWIGNSPYAEMICRRELREMIVRDSRHPCVLLWGLLNENFQLPEEMKKALLRYSAELDPTRPCIDDSGVSYACTWDMTAWVGQTWSIDNGVTEPVEDHHLYVPVPLDEQWYNWLANLGDPVAMRACTRLRNNGSMREKFHGRLQSHVMQQGNSVFVSEFGYGSLPDYESFLPLFRGHEQAVDCRQYAKLGAELRAFMESAGVLEPLGGWKEVVRQSQVVHGEGLLRMIEAMRLNPRISGYVVTQLNDASWEHLAGILDPWRQPKACYDYVRRANAPVVVIAQGCQPDVYAGDPLVVRAVVVNDSACEGPATLGVRVLDERGQPAFAGERSVYVRTGINPAEVVSVALPRPGVYDVELRIQSGQKSLVCEQRERIHVHARMDYSGVSGRVCMLGAPAGLKAPWKTADSLDAADVILVWDLPLRDPAPWAAVIAACRAGKRVIVLDHEPSDADLGAIKSEWGMLDLHAPWSALDGVFPEPVELRNSCGCFISNFHYAMEARLTRGLPVRRLMDERWAGLAPAYGLVHKGAGVPAAGAMCQRAFGTLALENAATLDERTVGDGRWIFCQLKVKAGIGRSPLADLLMRNLLGG